ncbi:MAG: HEAT repeat domain-containing protein [Gemmatimonadota bacterium]|nr:MAG: HEAT repeat domain-containing protein [Gemmatimonadota bacterium]
MMRALSVMVVGAAALLLAPAAFGQSIADTVDDVRDGKVRMSFASRAGICGDGYSSISMDGGRGWHIRRGHSDEWEVECEPGPVRVVLRVRERQVTGVDTYVGGRWRPAGSTTRDLGTVSVQRAVDYLLSLARGSRGDAGKEAIFPAMLADSVTVWPQLLDMAKDDAVRRDTRKNAVFWLGQAAADAATEGLTEIVYDDDADREVRKTAIFALSQRPDDEGVPALIEVVRAHGDPALVKNALFWLSQSDDPRAIDLFEEILLGRR